MKDANKAAGEADLERLAARVAMLASEDGEADNAGRAVAAMARRIGLTGGDLKRIFLAGTVNVPDGAERQRLEHEVSLLRQSLMQIDADARRTARERDVLRARNDRLQASLDRMRLGGWAWGLMGAAIALLAASVGNWVEPNSRAESPPAAEEASGDHRAAVVRPGGALLFSAPERGGVPVVALRAGQRVAVRRLVWKALYQWAEIEVPGGWTGYVLTTELDLS